MIKCWRQWSNKSCHSDLATEFTWDKQKYPTNFKVVGTFMLSHLRPARLLLTLSLELAPNYCYTRSSHIPDFSCPCDNLVIRPWYCLIACTGCPLRLCSVLVLVFPCFRFYRRQCWVGNYLMTIEIWWLVEVLEDPVLFIWSMFSNI